MLAPSRLPSTFATWNREHHAPYGRRLRVPRRFSWNRLALGYKSPFALQPNNSTRIFEYPWTNEQVNAVGSGLTIVELGGGLSGMQFTLARQGHAVTNIDPGEGSDSLGWPVREQQHAYLCKVFKAPVRLYSGTIDTAPIPDESADVVMSVSVIEHLSDAQIDAFCFHAPRMLKPGGRLILTVDLFLNLEPFTRRATNRWGRNINVRQLLDKLGMTLVVGEPSQLLGFDEFDPIDIQGKLSQFAIGGYPALAQCLVARKV